MIKWILAIFIALLVFSRAGSWLQRIGIGKLPGDFRFTVFGRQFFVPLSSTVLLSLMVFLVQRII